MTDPDDVEAIRLDYALRDLWRAAHTLADPEMAVSEWFLMVVSVLIAGQAPGRPLSWVMVLCARRVTADVYALG